MKRRAALALCLAGLASPAVAAEPQFHRLEGASDFLEGELQGLSVDSDGRVRLAPATKLLHDTEAPFVWCLAADAKGAVFAGTGNDGKVFRIEGGKATVFFDAPELEVHALAVGKDGRLYVGTSPDGRVYVVDPTGQSTSFFDPREKYIWALAQDPAGNLLVATGAEGRVYRVDAKGASTTLLQTTETHVLSLAVDPKGTLYAGSAPSGILYRVDGAGKVFVVNDSTYREVKALDLGKDGSVYAALVDGRPATADEAAPRAGVGAVVPTTPTSSVEVTVTEAFTGMPLPGASGASAPATTPGGPTKGALVRIGPGGEIDTLWSSSEDTPHSVLSSADGTLLATGGKGRLFRIRDDRSYTLVGILPSEQVTALARRGAVGTLIAVSGPGKVLSLEEGPGERGTFVSKPRDTETVSTWGRLRVEADVPSGTDLQVQTRAGNTETPDATWSDWSAVYKEREGQAITSERARFLQIRATFVGKEGKTPVLDSVNAAFLQRNLRPQVAQVTVHPPGEVFQKPITVTADPEVLGLDVPPPAPASAGSTKAGSGMPGPTAFSRKMSQRGLQTFSWRGEDPNGDTLAYDVYFRSTSETRFRLLRKGLTEAVLAWDTSTVPNGRYLVRVVASDAPSNPSGLALTGSKESTPFDVDNTPPTLMAQLLAAAPGRIRAIAKDDASPLRRAEYSVDGSRWEEIYPVDGINDGREETYEFAPEGLVGTGPYVIVVRAIDLLGNGASVRVELP